MKKTYIFLLSILMVLCTACSNENVSSTNTTPSAKNEAVPSGKADIPEAVFTVPDPKYSALLSRTMMSLGLNSVEGSWNNCVIQPDNALWNWSGNETQKVMDDVVAFSSNDYNVLAIKSDTSLWKFEREEHFNSSLGGPVADNPIHIMDDVTSVYSERNFSMAIRSDKSLWAWGANNFGQLGDGTTQTRQEPVKIMENVMSVSSSDGYVMAIQSDGSLWAWGFNLNGQLGDGTTKNRHKPVKIMDNVVAVSSVSWSIYPYSMALCSDGSLWTWGWDACSVFSFPEEKEKYGRPVKVMDDVVSFSTASNLEGVSFAMAIRSNGSLWTWGRNFYGQLGTGKQQDSSEPVCILDNIAYACAFSDQFAMAVGNDDSIWVWGNGMDVLIPQQSDNSDYGINTPFRVDLGNLPYYDSQPDWIMVGSRYTWGIAGYPPIWNTQPEMTPQVVAGTSVPCYYNIFDETGERIMEIGLISESHGAKTVSDIMQKSTDNLPFESFVFNDGNTGLMIRSGEQITWINGSAVMAFTANQSLDENSLLDIARTLSDRNRDNEVFLKAIDNKLAELGVSSTNASTAPEKSEKAPLSYDAAYNIAKAWLEAHPAMSTPYESTTIKEASDVMFVHNGEEYYMFYLNGYYWLDILVDSKTGELLCAVHEESDDQRPPEIERLDDYYNKYFSDVQPTSTGEVLYKMGKNTHYFNRGMNC